jgi:hypothetical protein
MGSKSPDVMSTTEMSYTTRGVAHFPPFVLVSLHTLSTSLIACPPVTFARSQ